MPGSKRRALKNLLSPHNSAATSPTGSATEQQQPPPPSVHSTMAPQDELALVEGMEQRQTMISPQGASPVSALSIPAAQQPAPVDVNGAATTTTTTTTTPTAEASAMSPKKKQHGGFAGLYRRDKEGTAAADEAAVETSSGGGGKKKSSKQRFLEREARKKEALLAAAPAVDEAANARLEKEKAEEAQIITQVCTELGVQLHEIEADGHCMYSAIADQLHLLGLSRDASYHNTRHAAATYLSENADAFMPFVASIHGEDMAGATDDGMMTPAGYAEYCKRVAQSGDWGGEIEIQALAKYYRVPIHVIQHGPPHIISHTPVDEGSGPLTAEQAKQAGDKVVRISYHRRMYGLGEHYNSLRPGAAAAAAATAQS
ncbi:hypothetical protein NliqN6_2169 [Naganishia liquefaciens]|uniref:OTU domain-containing protein n=1 Tax=Naganishia liquefaciens TaxID=104408 RepID=A0A8H3YF03_9TREE|nr:hypothetical protein NliqN6_2169 [Naganishia liquefaciens]